MEDLIHVSYCSVCKMLLIEERRTVIERHSSSYRFTKDNGYEPQIDTDEFLDSYFEYPNEKASCLYCKKDTIYYVELPSSVVKTMVEYCDEKYPQKRGETIKEYYGVEIDLNVPDISPKEMYTMYTQYEYEMTEEEAETLKEKLTLFKL